MSAPDKSPNANNKTAKAPVFPVGPAGRRDLRRALVRSTNPVETIQKFQREHSLHSMFAKAFGTTPSHEVSAEEAKAKTRSKGDAPALQVESLGTDSAMAFLSNLGVSQYEVHKRVGDTLLKHLEVEIKKTQKPEPLLNLLKSCWVYATTIPELRPVLWTVLKQLGKDTPPAVLKALGEQEENGELKHADIFRPLPPLLKRLVWETDWDDKISREMVEQMEPKAFLEQVKTTLLGHTILPHLKDYCRNEYLVTHANRLFVERVQQRALPTNQRRALNALSNATGSSANPAGSSSPKAASSTLSSLTNRAGSATTPTKSSTTNAVDGEITSGKTIASVKQLLSDPTGGTAAFRPKLLYAVLSILIAEHGSLDDNIMACSDHLHCTLVADLLLSASTGLPKAYQHVLRLAITLDDSVKAGVLQDTAILKIQSCLKDIFPAMKETPTDKKDDDKDKDNNKNNSSNNKKSPPTKGGKKDGGKTDPKKDAKGKTTPGKTANNPLKEPTTAFKRQLSRIIRGCLDAMKEADPQSLFLNPVTDAIAPGYSKVIKQPMCIMTMEKKIDDHDNMYKTLQEWEEDVKLMFQNCITYNRGAAGQWFRGEAQRQKKVHKEEILPQARILYDKEVALRTKTEDDDEDAPSRKRKLPGTLPDPKNKPGTVSSQISPVPAVFKNTVPGAAAAKPEAEAEKNKDKVYPSMPSLASMLLADPFVVRLILNRILRSVRLDIIRGKSLPTGSNVVPSLLQMLHMAQWSNQVCASRGFQYIVPGGGIEAPPETDQPSAEEFLMQIIPFDALRKFLPLLSQLFMENALDQRVIVGGDLHDAFNSMMEARPKPPDPEVWSTISSNNIQGVAALVQGALVHICLPGNSNEASLAVTYPKFAAVLAEASSAICDDRAFFAGLIDALLKHKSKLQRSTRDAVVSTWLDFLRKPPRHAKRKKGPKKQKKWGTSTSAAHECLITLFNEWAALGNQLLPRDKLLEFACDIVKAVEESETLAERRFLALWKESLETKSEEEPSVGDFTPIRKQYERMMKSLPEASRAQWKEQVGLVDEEESKEEKTEDKEEEEEEEEDKMEVDVKAEEEQ
ncbi:Bromodomain-containing protein 7 [Seminavis robusta]|uniref:Bromodomain-containing protein 7 n=1 Tax=Seminavis robusta TaxID=568900 RepID=A0A9N8DU74_9STRA|nr:Bromodomain-containing protein 7 [Seminavis robusta]|eukprot:Sro294_g110130.1 Bromodomain-containing protein 7 (1081) ;mRNA; f:5504-8746